MLLFIVQPISEEWSRTLLPHLSLTNITHSHRYIDFSRNSEPFRVSGIEYIIWGWGVAVVKL